MPFLAIAGKTEVTPGAQPEEFPVGLPYFRYHATLKVFQRTGPLSQVLAHANGSQAFT